MHNKKRGSHVNDAIGVVAFAFILILLIFSIAQNIVYYNLVDDIKKNYHILLDKEVSK